MAPVLRLNDLCREYRRGDRRFLAVDHVSLDVEAGSCVSVIGRSGSGKSTLLNLAAGMLSPTAGSVELLEYFRARGGYLGALLGDGGDPAFAERLKHMVRETVASRALEGIDLLAIGAFFDYYLTFAISAEVGVLVRWLTGGMRESSEAMARVMTALMFVRPGDLYGKKIEFDIPSLGLALLTMRENDDD